MNATFIYGDSDGRELNTSNYRILTPAKYLKAAGHTLNVQNNPGVTRVRFGKPVDIDYGIDYSAIESTVLIERNITPDVVEKLRVAGAKRIILTCDDNYGKMQAWAKASDWWARNYPKFEKSLGMVDLVVVPSQTLLDFYKPLCKSIAYLPNFLDDDLYRDLPGPVEPKRIGWGGSNQHAESWQNKKMVGALDRVLKENPDWELNLTNGGIPDIIHTFPKGMSLKWQEWLPTAEWPKKISTFTIGIAPLYGSYDRYRSNLKLLEYGICKVPWVASFYDPYTRDHVRGGVLVKDGDWHEALNLMVKDERARQTLSGAGYEWASTYLMSRNVEKFERVLWN